MTPFQARNPDSAHVHRPSLTLPGLTVLALATALPVVLSAARQAAAGGLVLAHERSTLLDALHTPELLAVRAADPTGEAARLAADGHDETVWTGRPGESQWRWTAAFARPVHIGLLRAHFGNSTTSGVPTVFHWETRGTVPDGSTCPRPAMPSDYGRDGDDAGGSDTWTSIEGAEQRGAPATDALAQPTHRSWFVDSDTCGVRLIIDRTNAGPPVLREVQAIESARDILLGGRASDDGAFPGFTAEGAIDGTYVRRWAGGPGRTHWTLRVDLPEPERVDRVRLVLGFDATSIPRSGGGNGYAIAWAPIRYTLEASEDGRRFWPIAIEPSRPDGSILPLRRRLVTLSEPRSIRSLRLLMNGATGSSGLPEADAVPVVRELAAYLADDPRPILASPWILSVNANPAGQSKLTPGGVMTNDAYHAKFLQSRFASLLPALAADDRYARALGLRGEPLDAPASDEAGAVLESIEGDDPQLDEQLLSQSSPPPITVLGGSNDWDYASETGPDPTNPRRWHWDPLRDARLGGMGQLSAAVKNRVAPFLGFCGGAQILALLEARSADAGAIDDDMRLIDRVLRRTSGHPIRGFAPPVDMERAWPTDPHPVYARIQFVPDDPLFVDVAGPRLRSTTQAFPESHSDAIRPDAFLASGPLRRFDVLATSAFCGPNVVAAGPRDGVFPSSSGVGWCDTVPEAFRSRDRSWPVIGAQFHPEQRDFANPAPGDPPESVADARLFLAAAYEAVVDSYTKLAP
ncbi:MAG TPA: discoidin domain-containing protein [Polyangiaceae bacterium]|nr:discoidin domain-containing protein [Polyangiaceae bacterium]